MIITTGLLVPANALSDLICFVSQYLLNNYPQCVKISYKLGNNWVLIVVRNR